MSDVTSADVKYYLNNLKDDLTLEETEDSWERITKAILSFVTTCERGGYEAAPVEIINALRTFSRPVLNAMNSERTRLCGASIDLLVSAATGLGREFEQLFTLFMPPLLALCGRTNKVVINRARTCIITIIESTQLASVLPYFLQNVKDKSASLRLIVAEGTLACLNSCNPPDLEKESRARDIESIIRSTARDANADVRKLSRKLFECYKILLPGRVDSFTAPLTPTMKKYLDIKANEVSTQQSTSRLRANLNMKPNIKPPTSASASTSTTARNVGHTRTASTSTASQIRNLTTSLTRVSRKEPIATVPAPYIPVRSVPASRTASESQTERGSKPTATRPGSAQEVKRPVPPLRSQATVISRTTTSAPRRLPMASGINPTLVTSGPQSLASDGPRRVPMPMPPPPAPAKEKVAIILKRPTSRADTASSSSGQRPAVSAAPDKKPVVTVASSLRGPTTTKASVQPKATKPTTVAASSSGNTKPLVINSKPLWGRSAPVPKAAAAASKRTAAPPSKTLSKKPSGRHVPTPTSDASKTRPTTPALIALPPSPTPKDNTDTDEILVMEEPEKGPDQNDDQRSGDETPSSRRSPTPTIDSVKLDDEQQEVQEQKAKPSPIPSETTADPTSVNGDADHNEPESHSNSSTMSSTDETPNTPQGVLVNPTNTNAAITAKTPISALLSSIQRGFLYSPSSPLSPADTYLLPGPHRTTANKNRDAPVQPFNFALHPPSNHTFGKSMALGDIGVVNVTDHKLFTPSTLMLDDAPRQAFVDINK